MGNHAWSHAGAACISLRCNTHVVVPDTGAAEESPHGTPKHSPVARSQRVHWYHRRYIHNVGKSVQCVGIDAHFDVSIVSHSSPRIGSKFTAGLVMHTSAQSRARAGTNETHFFQSRQALLSSDFIWNDTPPSDVKLNGHCGQTIEVVLHWRRKGPGSSR